MSAFTNLGDGVVTQVLKKSASVALAISMIASFASVPLTAFAFLYTVKITSVTSTPTSLTISGPIDVVDFTGKLDAQWVKFDWGDGTVEIFHATDTAVFPNYVLNQNGKDFTIHNYTRSHTYGSPGDHTATVKVYHSKENGNEGSAEGLASAQTENTQARCTDTLDNDNDGLIDAADPDCAVFQVGAVIVKKVIASGTAATSTFMFMVDGGSPIAFESDGSNLLSLTVGTHSIVEVADVHYSPAYAGCSSISVTSAATSTCTITNTFRNNAPVAQASSFSTNEDTPYAGAVTATDADGDSLLHAVVVSPLKGLLQFFPNGTFNYSPFANQNGSDFFTFKAYDGFAYSNTAQVDIMIIPVNDAPVANDDSASTNEDTSVTTGNVLTNDTDLDLDVLSVTAAVASSTNAGSVVNNGDGTFTYTPALNFSGTDTFSYTVTDGALTDTGTVTVTVSSTNDAPVAVGESYTTDEDVTLTVPVTGVLGNDSDPDGNSITAVVDTTTSSGTLTLNADGSFSYIPNANFNGSDTFTYHATDGTANSGSVTVTITVNAVNDAPVAAALAVSADQNTATSSALQATDVDGNTLTFATTSSPLHGTITFFDSATGIFTYMPDLDYTGADSFGFKANDGTADSNVATVSISVAQLFENTLALCTDTLDNDNDGQTDLADRDCVQYIPSLTVIKNVVNNNSGSSTPSDFTMNVAGTSVSSTTFTGSSAGVSVTLMPGAYSVTESGPAGYGASLSAECSGTIAAGQSLTCTITNDDDAPAPATPPSSGGGGGGGGGGNGPINFGGGNTNPGLVLGAAIEAVADCTKYLTAYIRQGRANDTAQVTRLQQFLNSLEGFNLDVNGTYDNATLAAVNSFQSKYMADILTPWGASRPTGYVYYTTQKKVNEIYCKFTTSFPLSADQLAEIERFKAQGTTFNSNSSSSVTPNVSAPAAPAKAATPADSNNEEVGATQPTNIEPAAVGEAEKKTGFFGRIINWLFK